MDHGSFLFSEFSWPLRSRSSLSRAEQLSSFLTYGDRVDLALDLQGALVALVSVDDLFELRVADHQVLCSLMVLLQRAEEEKKREKKKEKKKRL